MNHPCEKVHVGLCEQCVRRLSLPSAQSDLGLLCSHITDIILSTCVYSDKTEADLNLHYSELPMCTLSHGRDDIQEIEQQC